MNPGDSSSENEIADLNLRWAISPMVILVTLFSLQMSFPALIFRYLVSIVVLAEFMLYWPSSYLSGHGAGGVGRDVSMLWRLNC